mgnify:FL=1
MKQFQINIFVHEDELIRAYTEGHDIAESDCPDIEQMIASELNWLSSSGISFSDEIKPIDHNSYTLNFKILQLASGHYLTAEYPDDWQNLPEDEQLKFVSDNSWQPFEDYDPEFVIGCIESAAEVTQNFLEDLKHQS